MEKQAVVTALSALAQDTRLDIFRVLVEAGAGGLAAGRIADRLGLPSATLSFHLSQLKHAGLVASRRDGRSLIYSVRFDAMGELVGYLTENCCGQGPEACDIGPGAGIAAAHAPARGVGAT